MSFFTRKKDDILEKAIEAELEIRDENLAIFEQKKQEFHQVKPMAAAHVMESYVESILKLRGKIL